jgi:hypothetical protein
LGKLGGKEKMDEIDVYVDFAGVHFAEGHN